jgi:hypothetical protein
MPDGSEPDESRTSDDRRDPGQHPGQEQRTGTGGRRFPVRPGGIAGSSGAGSHGFRSASCRCPLVSTDRRACNVEGESFHSQSLFERYPSALIIFDRVP